MRDYVTLSEMEQLQHCKKCGHVARQEEFVSGGSDRFVCPECEASEQHICVATEVFKEGELGECYCGKIFRDPQRHSECRECENETRKELDEIEDLLDPPFYDHLEDYNYPEN